MIPQCIVAAANYCFPQENYNLSFQKANAETRPATTEDLLITGFVQGVIAAGVLQTAPTPSEFAPFADAYVLTAVPAGANLDMSSCLNMNLFGLSTGLKRDCAVLSKTFTTPLKDKAV